MSTNPKKPSGENWSRAAKSYSSLIDETDALNPAGAACRQILKIVDAELPFEKATCVTDMGCGNGPVISSILESPQHLAQIPGNTRIVAVDVAQALLDMLSQRKAEQIAADHNSAWKRLEVRNWDARNLKSEIADGEVSHLLSSYAYFAFADEKTALAEAYRVLKPGGLFVETSMGWTEWGHLPSLFEKVRPDNPIPGPGQHWQSVEGVKTTLEAAGFQDVGAREYEIGIPVDGAEDAIAICFGAFPWVKGFVAEWSEEEVERAKREMRRFVKERHPQGGEGGKLVLRGTGLVGWGRK